MPGTGNKFQCQACTSPIKPVLFGGVIYGHQHRHATLGREESRGLDGDGVEGAGGAGIRWGRKVEWGRGVRVGGGEWGWGGRGWRWQEEVEEGAVERVSDLYYRETDQRLLGRYPL